MTYYMLSKLFFLLLTFLKVSRSITASPVESDIEVSLDDRLSKMEANQNLIKTRILRWENHFEQIMRKLESIESRLNQQMTSNNGPSPVEPHRTLLTSAASPMAYESVASKIDTLSLDTQTAIDEVHEKVLRLEERLGHHERTSNQQLERLLSVAGSGLEMAASLRTETAMESRRHMRSLESKLASLSTTLEARFQHLFWIHSINQTQPTSNISSPGGGNQKPGKLNGPVPKNQKRNILTHADLDGHLDVLVDSYKQRLKPTPSKALRASSGRKQLFNETVVMDQSASGSQVRDPACNCTCASSISEDGWKQFLQQQSSTLTHKLGNMYDQLWRHGKLMADQLQLVAQTVNESKWNMDEGFRMIFSGYPSAAAAPFLLPQVSQTLEMTIKDLDRFIRQRMDLFEEKLENQVSDGTSCSSDWESSQLVAEALENLVYLAGNRTQNLADEVAELQLRMEKYNEQQTNLITKLVQNMHKDVHKETNDSVMDIKPAIVTGIAEEEEEKPSEALLESNDYTYIDPQEVEEDRNL